MINRQTIYVRNTMGCNTDTSALVTVVAATAAVVIANLLQERTIIQMERRACE